MEQIFNHDGYGILAALDATAKTERDAAELLVTPLAEAGVTAIDWCIVSTGAHNCRTRHGMLYDQRQLERFLAEKSEISEKSSFREAICRVIEHYAAQPLDLLDAVIPATHNHEPDRLDWPVDHFTATARTAPRRAPAKSGRRSGRPHPDGPSNTGILTRRTPWLRGQTPWFAPAPTGYIISTGTPCFRAAAGRPATRKRITPRCYNVSPRLRYKPTLKFEN